MHEIATPPRSAYLHIPFCHRRCFYCDFVVEPLGDKAGGEHGNGRTVIKSYIDLLKREIASSPKGPPLSTIYLGGGTPSLLTPTQIESLLSCLKDHFGFQDGYELTLEIDPASFDRIALEGYLNAGVNRLSLGGQSFEDDILLQLGRTHTSEDLINACIWLMEAYNSELLKSWSLDLIQNLPGHNLTLWEKELNKAIQFSSPHLSIYDLSIESGTVFDKKYKQGDLKIPEEDLAADLSMMTNSILKEVGYSRYEISNYSLPGHASRHNRVYWSGAGWWGFGQGATSSPWGRRFSRPRTKSGYAQWVEEQETIGTEPSLESNNAHIMDLDEMILVGLRRREGVDLEKSAICWGWNENQCNEYLNLLIINWDEFIRRGVLHNHGMRYQLTDPEGMEISNGVILKMMEWWENLPPHALISSSL